MFSFIFGDETAKNKTKIVLFYLTRTDVKINQA